MSIEHPCKVVETAVGQASRLLRKALVIAAFLALTGTGAQASTGELDMAGLQPVGDGQLAGMRGGYNLGGVQIDFGVVIETAINGLTTLRTAFTLDNPNPTVTINGADAMVGQTVNGFTLLQAPNGGFALRNADGSLATVQQMGNMGGGILLSVQNALNHQVIQQNANMNLVVQNMNTVRGLTTIGIMLDRLGMGLLR